MFFKIYKHFHLLAMGGQIDGQTDSNSDYSVHLWVVQYCLDFKHMHTGTVEVLEQSVLVRVVPELNVGEAEAIVGEARAECEFRQRSVPVLHTSSQKLLNCISKQDLINIYHANQEL